LDDAAAILRSLEGPQANDLDLFARRNCRHQLLLGREVSLGEGHSLPPWAVFVLTLGERHWFFCHKTAFEEFSQKREVPPDLPLLVCFS
jgi:hypothetical protein